MGTIGLCKHHQDFPGDDFDPMEAFSRGSPPCPAAADVYASLHGCRGGLGSFEGWQTAALKVLKRILPGQGLVGAAGKVCRGLSGAWELQGRVWGVLRAGKRQP